MESIPITEQELNIMRGRALVEATSSRDVQKIFVVLDHMEAMLDEADECDALGTEGWRHRIGWGD
jgi:hypothetical protein